MAILDDFLLVLPRRTDEADEDLLQRARTDTSKFDKLLHDLRLPKAQEKDQDPAFTSIWLGWKFCTKSNTLNVTKKKWIRLREFFLETFVQKDGRSLKDTIVGELLREALGKLHHAAVVWSQGRPLLYSLWCVFYKAKFYKRDKDSTRILCPNQVLHFGYYAKRDLQIWFNRLSNKKPQVDS